jgi:prepilin-type N-terminal cleavage/methylation domain-containing protein
MLLGRRGYTLVEMLIVMLFLAVALSFTMPRAMKPTPRIQVGLAARSMTRDMEQMRMRAIAAKRSIRLRFEAGDDFYSAFMDLTPARLGVIGETADEARASGLLSQGSNSGIPGVRLSKGVSFGRGSASGGPPGSATSGAIVLEGDRVEFDSRGLVTPAGTGGVIYLVHEDDPTAVAAVTISDASAFATWIYRGGAWSR